MLTVRRPTRERIDAFLARQIDAPWSYAGVGGTQSTPPAGFTVDHHRIQVGIGAAGFDRAVASMRRWAMFDIRGITLCWPSVPLQPDRAVGVLVRLPGLWSLNACRIVYVIDTEGEVRRFGFGYGTLDDHMAAGEERFSVERRRDDDSVWYDLYAFSRPRHPLARLGRPCARAVQRRFARESLAAMVRASRA